ncbi:ribosome assembly cofactor RimP [Aurantibacter aestuarii]|uniref:Ribosome maturation factor RimP n=1 Tax=Aurantibacter aestuarii TaxID=1266046 RepID=A0A2T1NDV3_9FLAO|nr:ribosome assembly cofactor RimP [Aurantibacter aestuarii]PSG90624.1 ribosome assembly cofactor RimP [Aurantibacter aestuarii]
MFLDTVKQLLQEALEERKDLFLIDFSVGSDHAIKIIIDGDSGVKVEDCMFISRAIEHNIDREEHDFSLEVMSAGATAPLTLPRQYDKHIGRVLEVKTTDGLKLEAELKKVSNDGIDLEWKSREPKPVGKGKVTVHNKKTIAFGDISSASVVIKF